MQAHEQRVIDEKAELDEKIAKLRVFINDNPAYLKLPAAQATLMHDQVSAMARYSEVLSQRIMFFTV
jgi:hypothetical protein